MDILLDEIRCSIAEMSGEFTTHELILTLAQMYQREYITALYEHRDAARPFQIVHSKIGKCLRNHPELVEFVPGGRTDVDIFGQKSENAGWRKHQ